MNVLWTVVIGFVAGAVAKFLMPGRDGGGLILTAVLGVSGAALANFLGRAAGWYGEEDGAGLVAAVAGALIILALFRLIRKREASP